MIHSIRWSIDHNKMIFFLPRGPGGENMQIDTDDTQHEMIHNMRFDHPLGPLAQKKMEFSMNEWCTA